MKNFLLGLLLFFMQSSIIVLLFALNTVVYSDFIIVVMAALLFLFAILFSRYLYGGAKGNIVPIIISFSIFTLLYIAVAVLFASEDYMLIFCIYLNFWLNLLPNGACIIVLLIGRMINKIKAVENKYGRRG